MNKSSNKTDKKRSLFYRLLIRPLTKNIHAAIEATNIKVSDLYAQNDSRLNEIEVINNKVSDLHAHNHDRFTENKETKESLETIKINVGSLYAHNHDRFTENKETKELVDRLSQEFNDIKKVHFDIINRLSLFENATKTTSNQSKNNFLNKVKFTIFSVAYNSNEQSLIEMIDSVLGQTYPAVQFIILDLSEKEYGYIKEVVSRFPEIEYHKDCKDIAIRGDYITIVNSEDILNPSALYEIASSMQFEGLDMVYSNDIIFEKDVKYSIKVRNKPNFSKYALRTYNYLGDFITIRAKLINVNDLSKNIFEIILDVSERAKSIIKISKPLYFNRIAKKNKAINVIDIVFSHLNRQGIKAEVSKGYAENTCKVFYDIVGEPSVSIIIPNCNHLFDLKRVITSIQDKATYKNYEIIIVENNSTDKELFDYYEDIKKFENIKVVTFNLQQFNYSSIMNYGALNSSGSYLLFLNNDMEIITGNFIEELLSYAQLEDVGVVSAKLLYEDNTIQHAGMVFSEEADEFIHIDRKLSFLDSGEMNRLVTIQDYPAVTGACQMLSRKKFDQVQGFDENIKVVYSDVDLCLKLRVLGYCTLYIPTAMLLHIELSTRQSDEYCLSIEKSKTDKNIFFNKHKNLINKIKNNS